MSTTMKYFNSNETLEMCDVRISENGTIEVATKSYHSEELQRLGMPEKAIRGRRQGPFASKSKPVSALFSKISLSLSSEMEEYGIRLFFILTD